MHPPPLSRLSLHTIVTQTDPPPAFNDSDGVNTLECKSGVAEDGSNCHSAGVTRDVAQHLADLSDSLRADGHATERIANFLMSCIFTMFADDVLPVSPDSFRDRLKLFTAHTPAHQRLNPGLFPGRMRAELQRFNSSPFANAEVLPLNECQIALLYTAANCRWREVEPAIFGTLLERAFHPKERQNLGAHITPRAYIERLVLPTVIDPLREDWQKTVATAVLLDGQGKWQEAVQTCRDFLYQLTQTIVLDPACRTGNFLYVVLDHMKRLEGQVHDAIAKFTGSRQADTVVTELQVDPHQFLGIEINSRAAAIAELVLWIGYIQWQLKTVYGTRLPKPVLKTFHNIECRDAILDYDQKEPLLNRVGQPITRWDGETLKPHPTTGEPVPDHKFRVPAWRYINPRKARWPAAHFIIGHPPSMDSARVHALYGDAYTEILRAAHPDVPESADFGMYWWNHAANILRRGIETGSGILPVIQPSTPGKDPIRHFAHGGLPALRRFGSITTNSLRHTTNRRVLQDHINTGGISLTFAIPDHPWVKSTDGTTMRIAMTVARPGRHPGILQTVSRIEIPVCANPAHMTSRISPSESITFNTATGLIHADLTTGADVASAIPLPVNKDLAFLGVILHGNGFIINHGEARKLGLGRLPGIENIIRPYRNGRDITQDSRDVVVIDLFGHDFASIQVQYPEVYQWICDKVKPERDRHRDKKIQAGWWLHGDPQPELRAALAGLPRYIATAPVSKHRFFVFLDAAILPDVSLLSIALDDAFYLGVLSSRIHTTWATAIGRSFDIRTPPPYDKTRCFETFPFPTATPAQADRIRDLANRLDAHRKGQRALHPRLTLTMCYNVLEKKRNHESLTPKDQAIDDHGQLTILHQIHADLDLAVAEAYNWPPDLPEEEILTRLVDLNHQRAMKDLRAPH